MWEEEYLLAVATGNLAERPTNLLFSTNYIVFIAV